MNYRHVYHAGNFADVIKHVTLSLVIEYLKRKASPFRVIDTHAGIGQYDLNSEAAGKTGEWREGIGRLWGQDLPDGIKELLAPYFTSIRSVNGDGELRCYPGSPLVARGLMRAQDSLVVNELHPEDYAALVRILRGDVRVKILNIDGWIALRSLLPPKERRGVILIDPPFEVAGELDRLVSGLKDGLRRFATGTYLLWYPIKGLPAVETMKQRVAQLGIDKLLCAELFVHRPGDEQRLNGSGLLIINPPYFLDAHLGKILPFLAERLAQSREARSHLTWLAGSSN
ncbi:MULTISPECIES: 23S rRNA (adenine(2030)-N(6))-methyltransferase RlmJ [Filomicrobium]|uniref:Ribosomal RNA large subunit methyltransferase J n=1 Tax=Filomicrobium insigne TaxID=418854 RepID=A0A1H0M7Z3_9HYPH|nr:MULTISPECIES: 23S rRNA (adenine(2030)-N(6))-methyltransferase RlmJ [Filomicrobium]MCV0368859.1 23S rRNA (adenine(2030)-N(6))-methyltransferase RlmJ [Filomicrobium sp.]SDO76411.1 23S rRNA (adenine2030-N6)-methyltransferase [Filomicrobium insigne]